MEIAVLALLSALVVALYALGRAFKERTPISMAACLLIVAGSLVLVGGIGQTTNNSELTNLSTRAHDSLGNLVQSQNSTGNATSTNSWSASSGETTSVGSILLLFGIYLLFKVITEYLEELDIRRNRI
jgi:hypothetical protein